MQLQFLDYYQGAQHNNKYSNRSMKAKHAALLGIKTERRRIDQPTDRQSIKQTNIKVLREVTILGWGIWLDGGLEAWVDTSEGKERRGPRGDKGKGLGRYGRGKGEGKGGKVGQRRG